MENATIQLQGLQQIKEMFKTKSMTESVILPTLGREELNKRAHFYEDPRNNFDFLTQVNS